MNRPDMPLALWLCVVLSAEPAPSSLPSLTVPRFKGSGVDAERLALYADHFSHELGATGLPVIGDKEIAAQLGRERQRALTGDGCAESCLSEIAAAMGSPWSVTGDVSKVEDGWKVTVSLLEGLAVTRAASYGEQVSSEAGILRALSRAGWRLGSVVLARQNKLPQGLPPDAVTIGDPPPGRSLAWAPAIAGVAGVASGAVLVGLAFGNLNALNPRNPISLEEGQRLRDQGKAFHLAGTVALCVGSAALVTAVLMYFVGGGHPRNVQLSLLPVSTEGAFASLSLLLD